MNHPTSWTVTRYLAVASLAAAGAACTGSSDAGAASDSGTPPVDASHADTGKHATPDAGAPKTHDARADHATTDSGTPENPGDAGMPTPTDARVDSSAEDPGTDPPAGYHLVWEDLFDTGSTPDTAKWGLYDSVGNAGNGLRRPSAFSVHDGMVDVVAQMEDGGLVSGGMAATYSAIYGYFEFRVRSGTDASQATDAVVLTWPDDGVWPEHGENDIYETGTSASRDPFNTYIHYGTVGSDQVWIAENADGTQWHVMGMLWTASEIAIYRDGALIGTVTDTSEIPTWSHHPCIQLDAYQQMMGAPVHMYVDWIRVYQP
jgi:beta-glucanase (GH16 family)